MEAGLEPNSWNSLIDEENLLERLARVILELGRFPTKPEFKMHRRGDRDFPCYEVYKRRFVDKHTIARKLIEYCQSRDGLSGVSDVCQTILKASPAKPRLAAEKQQVSTEGYVYLLKSGPNYKIGRSNSHGRRMYELGIQLPEQAENIHVITTDDPVGIEAYSHKRFLEKRKNGEWFALDAADVRAFKRRKFM